MKKIISMVMMVMVVMVCQAEATLTTTTFYPATWIVSKTIEVEDEADEVICRDASGMEWSFYSDTGDWRQGDLVSVILNTRGTADVSDDEIIGAPKCETLGTLVK